MSSRKLVAVAVLAAVLACGQAAQAGHRLGGGVRYNASVESMGENFDGDGLSYLVSYQYTFFPLKVEADLEIMPSSLTGSETVLIPQASLLLGGILYGGIGIGVPYADGEFGDDPIYNLRAGLDIQIVRIHIDINANYRFTDFDQVSDFDSDNIQIGLIGRYAF